jgi:hypothetical protein
VVSFWTCSREVLETRLRLFTDYHDRGLSGFAQTNARMILWKRTKIMVLSSDNDVCRLN